MNFERKRKILDQYPIFSGVRSEVLNSLLENAQFQEYSQGQLILEEGDPVDRIHFVVHGHLEGFCETEDGEMELVSQYQRSDSFGDIALVTESPAWCSVRAVTDCLILELKREILVTEIKSNPELQKVINSRLGSLFKEERERSSKPQSKIISLLSPSSETGKSTLAFNLAGLLEEQTNVGTCVFDFTTTPAPTLDKETLQSPRLTDDWFEANVNCHESGFNYLSAELPEEFSEGALRAFLAALLEHNQILIFVLPEGYDESIQKFLEVSDKIYLVTPEDEGSIYQTNLLLDQIESESVTNQTEPEVLLSMTSEYSSRSRDQISEELGGKIRYQLPYIEASERSPNFKSPPLALRNRDHSYSKTVRYLAHEAGEISFGLALGSGAARGLAHIGVLEIFETENVEPDMVAGASMGGLIAAAYALGHSSGRMRRHAREFHEQGGFFRLRDLSFPPTRSILRSSRIRRFLEDIFGDARFKDTNIPLKIIVADLESSEVKVISSGSIVDAVLSSVSIPMIFEPNQSGNSTFLDGGILEPIPVNKLKESGMDNVIAVNPIPPKEVLREQQPERMVRGHDEGDIPELLKYVLPFGKNNLIDIGMRTIEAIESRLAEFTTAEADIIIDPYLAELNWFDFDEYEMFIEQGRRSARQKIDEIQALVNPLSTEEDEE